MSGLHHFSFTHALMVGQRCKNISQKSGTFLGQFRRRCKLTLTLRVTRQLTRLFVRVRVQCVQAWRCWLG